MKWDYFIENRHRFSQVDSHTQASATRNPGRENGPFRTRASRAGRPGDWAILVQRAGDGTRHTTHLIPLLSGG